MEQVILIIIVFCDGGLYNRSGTQSTSIDLTRHATLLHTQMYRDFHVVPCILLYFVL